MLRVLRPGGEVRFKAFSRADMRFGKGEEVEPGTFIRGAGVLTHYFSRGRGAGPFSGCVGGIL